MWSIDSGWICVSLGSIALFTRDWEGIEAHTRHRATAKEPNKRSPGSGAESSSGVHFEYMV